MDLHLALVSKPSPAAAAAGTVLDSPSVIRLLRLLLALPHGAIKKSHALEGITPRLPQLLYGALMCNGSYSLHADE